MTNIENEQHLIIEGCYLLPHHVKKLQKAYPDKIVSVFIGFTTKYLSENFANLINFRNVIESRKYPEEGTVADYIYAHEKLWKKCTEHGVTYFAIDNDYEKEIEQVYDFIDTQMCKYSDDKSKVSDDIL